MSSDLIKVLVKVLANSASIFLVMAQLQCREILFDVLDIGLLRRGS